MTTKTAAQWQQAYTSARFRHGGRIVEVVDDGPGWYRLRVDGRLDSQRYRRRVIEKWTETLNRRAL